MEFIAKYLPWLLSAITIYMTVLAGNRTPWAWAVGLGNQALWLVWIVVTASWGFLPMNLALWIVYGRNHIKWMKQRGIEQGALVAPAPSAPERPAAAKAVVEAHKPEAALQHVSAPAVDGKGSG